MTLSAKELKDLMHRLYLLHQDLEAKNGAVDLDVGRVKSLEDALANESPSAEHVAMAQAILMRHDRL